MIRLSVTALETFRYWRDNEDSTIADLVLKLRGQEPPTEKMEAGRAFAKLMELAPVGDVVELAMDGWHFVFDVDGAIKLPHIRELKGEAPFTTPYGPVTLVGKVDGLDGVTVHDQKLTERFDPENYLDSMQWRAYLVMFEAKRFVYDVFQARINDHRVTVTSFESFAFATYPSIRDDVRRAVIELAAVVSKHCPEMVTP